jgi:UDP-glucose 4-epimerase
LREHIAPLVDAGNLTAAAIRGARSVGSRSIADRRDSAHQGDGVSRFLVTGGTGYIGAHVVRHLQSVDAEVVVVDDVATGYADRIPDVPLHRVDLAEDGSVDAIRRIAGDFEPDTVIHFAARKQVGESVERPAWYYRQNVGGLANLLAGIEGAPVQRFVFSSSAAVYGDAQGVTIAEDDPTVPVSPYGDTKLFGEVLMRRVAHQTGLRTASLRYFNVAGCTEPALGDRAVLNLIPMVFERLDAGGAPQIFGDDYPTRDGTCVRDFIHVEDLARAHVDVAQWLTDQGPATSETFNVGTGHGTTVREMVDCILDVASSSVQPEILGRRAGDPASVVASVDKITQTLGWHATRTVREMVESAWHAHRTQMTDPAQA